MNSLSIVRLRGFSMMELILVILLLGIMSVIAMGRLFDQNQFAARGFFDDTAAAVQFAQKLAVSTGCDVQVILSPTGYALFQRADSCSVGAFTRAVAHPANRSNTYQNTEVAGLTVPSTTITFNARGLAASDADVTMTGPSASYRFQVSSNTGMTNVITP